MITEWLVMQGVMISEFMAGLFPAWSPPEWFQDPSGLAAQITQFVTGMGAWVPLSFISGVVGVVFASWAVTALVRLLRAVASHVPQFGGSGA